MYADALEHFKKVDPILYNIGKQLDPKEISSSENLFISLCCEIIGQQLSGKVARVIFARFQDLFSEKIITPEKLLNIPDQKIRDIGTSWSKITYLKDLATKIHSKELDLEKLKDLDNESVIEELTKVKGIGSWTGEMFLMFALGREDIFAPGDLGLKNAIIKWYGMKDKPTPQDLLEISRKWSPYRTYASLILWNSLDSLIMLVKK